MCAICWCQSLKIVVTWTFRRILSSSIAWAYAPAHVDIFYILLLEKAPRNAEEYEVEEILDTNKISRKPYYLVK
jgi:hypothetical protein